MRIPNSIVVAADRIAKATGLEFRFILDLLVKEILLTTRA